MKRNGIISHNEKGSLASDVKDDRISRCCLCRVYDTYMPDGLNSTPSKASRSLL